MLLNWYTNILSYIYKSQHQCEPIWKQLSAFISISIFNINSFITYSRFLLCSTIIVIHTKPRKKRLCVCACVCVWEREREKDRESKRAIVQVLRGVHLEYLVICNIAGSENQLASDSDDLNLQCNIHILQSISSFRRSNSNNTNSRWIVSIAFHTTKCSITVTLHYLVIVSLFDTINIRFSFVYFSSIMQSRNVFSFFGFRFRSIYTYQMWINFRLYRMAIGRVLAKLKIKEKGGIIRAKVLLILINSFVRVVPRAILWRECYFCNHFSFRIVNALLKDNTLFNVSKKCLHQTNSKWILSLE